MTKFLLEILGTLIVCVIAGNLGASVTPLQNIHVSNVSELYSAVQKANRSNDTNIVLADGLYKLNQRLQFTGSRINLRSLSRDPATVILLGQGMRKTNNTEVLIDVSGSYISISGITLAQSSNHLIQVRAEKNADNFSLSNCVLRDSYEQLLKVSSSPSDDLYSDNGSIKHCLFEYTADVGPQFYIGGIDAHRSRNWTVAGNTFKNIASPGQHVAEHAIHFWRKSANITVINNTIENCDRGIGFGLGDDTANQTKGGLIANNVIRNTNLAHQFTDVGIGLEASPDVQIINNRILIEGNYPNAIEYRFAASKNIFIQGNETNKSIVSRDGGQAEISGNQEASVFNHIKHKVEQLIDRL